MGLLILYDKLNKASAGLMAAPGRAAADRRAAVRPTACQPLPVQWAAAPVPVHSRPRSCPSERPQALPVHMKVPSHDFVQSLLRKHDQDGSQHLTYDEYYECVKTGEAC